MTLTRVGDGCVVPNHQSFQSLRDVVELQEPTGAPLSCWGKNKHTLNQLLCWRNLEVWVKCNYSLRTPLSPGSPPFEGREAWVHWGMNPKAKEWIQESARQKKAQVSESRSILWREYIAKRYHLHLQIWLVHKKR